jgi:hypothetical protein
MVYNTQNYWGSDFIHVLVLIGLFRSINFYFRIYPSSTNVRALEKFLLHFFLLALIDSTWSQVFSVPDKIVSDWG